MIGFATMAQIPCVIVDVMRGGPSTGLPTEPAQGDVMQARWGTHGEHSIIALVPELRRWSATRSPSRRSTSRSSYRTPVIILSDALRRAHARGRGAARRRRAPHRRARRAGLRAGRVRHRAAHDRQHPAAAAAGLAVHGARHRARLQPPQRHRRTRATRRSPATWAATCARRSTTTATPSCAWRRSRWTTPRWPSSPTARWPARPRPWCAGRAPEACASASSGPSRCGRSRPAPWSTWPSRCAPSSCPR